MSLYNMIHGVNPAADLLFPMIGLRPDVRHHIPRFRDIYATADGTEVIIYTRVGGGNREAYADQIRQMRSLKTYLRDEDDDFDSTFASFYFRPISPLAADLLKLLHDEGKAGAERPARARQLLEDLKAGRETDLTRQAMESMAPLAQGLGEVISGKAATATTETLSGGRVEVFSVGETPVWEETPEPEDEG